MSRPSPFPDSSFKYPSNPKQWFVRPCCAKGHTDTSKCCEFCGKPVETCARLMSEDVKNHPERNYDGCRMGTAEDDPHETACSACGFWCPDCGMFWSQDTCAGDSVDYFENCYKETLQYDSKTREIRCICGLHVATARVDE